MLWAPFQASGTKGCLQALTSQLSMFPHKPHHTTPPFSMLLASPYKSPKPPITASCSSWHLSLSFLPPLCALAMRDSQLPLSPSGTGPPQYLCPLLFSLPGILSPRALQAHASILFRSLEPLYSLLQKLTLSQSVALTLLSFPSKTDGTGFVLRCFADEHTLVCMLPFSTSEEAGLCTAYKRCLINTSQIQINL